MSEPHHHIRRPDEVVDELAASGLPFPSDMDRRVHDALSSFADYAQRPMETPRHFPRTRAYLTGMRQFRHPDGLAPSFSWPKPLDRSWADGHYRANALTFWRFEPKRSEGQQR